jgi:hypothetical protein
LHHWPPQPHAGELYGDNATDAGVYDSLLHSQDRAYTVPQLYEWLADGHGFANVLPRAARPAHAGFVPKHGRLTLLHHPHLGLKAAVDAGIKKAGTSPANPKPVESDQSACLRRNAGMS